MYLFYLIPVFMIVGLLVFVLYHVCMWSHRLKHKRFVKVTPFKS